MYQWTYSWSISELHSFARESRALISSGRREKYGRMFASGIREHNGIMLSIVSRGREGAVAAVLYGEASATHARVCAHTNEQCARAQRQDDGRAIYSIAVCRICSLCRDHVLVLIRAPDKIALCYRGSCLRDSKEKGGERGREGEREKEREPLHRCAFTYGLPSVLPSASPFVPRPYPRILFLREKDSMFCVKIMIENKRLS